MKYLSELIDFLFGEEQVIANRIDRVTVCLSSEEAMVKSMWHDATFQFSLFRRLRSV